MDHLQVTVEFVFDRLSAVELTTAYQVLVPDRGRAIRRGQRGDGHDPHGVVRPGVLDPAEAMRDDRQPGAALHEYAIEQGWEIPEEWLFVDGGWSGATLVRPGLERLRDLSAQRIVEQVLCLSPDRLARNYAHQVLLVEEFTRCGTVVVFIHNPVATTPERALMVQFQGMIAEYERALIAERTRRGKVHRARAGAASVLGRAPYGYRYLSKAEHGEAAYAVAEPEATVVARIFARYATGGVSMQALAKELSHDQIPSPSGNLNWDAGTLGRMLRNPAYAGRAAFGKTQIAADPPRANRTSRQQGRSAAGKTATTARPRPEWIEIPVPEAASTSDT